MPRSALCIGLCFNALMTPDALESADSWRDWLGRHLRLQAEDKFEIYVNVARSATMRDATYWAELLLSAGIATLGLTLNSPAVIIGAMLISPLMGPIMASGLALAAGDFILALRALLNLMVSSIAAIAFSTVLVALLPFREMTAEIAARTHPNTLDLVVALFSGAVGALGVSKSLQRAATSIPGVAIAVALMPPLCVTGYGVGVILTVDREQGSAIVAGGGLLFITNLVAITFASMIVFLLLHIDSSAVRDQIRDWRVSDAESSRFQARVERFVPDQLEKIGSLPARIALVAALVAVVLIPLKRSFDTLSGEIHQRQHLNRIHRAATDQWERMFATTPAGNARSYIDRLDAAERSGRLLITVRTFISDSISADEKEAFRRAIATSVGQPVERVHVAIVEIPTSTYQVAQQAKKEPEIAPPPPAESAGTRLSAAGREIIAQIATSRLPAGATMLDSTLTIGTGAPAATVIYVAAAPISEDARSMITGDLRVRLDLPALDVRLLHVSPSITIPFARRTASLRSEDAAPAAALGEAVRTIPSVRLTISTAASDPLASRRAAAVRDAIVGSGVPDSRIVLANSSSLPEDQVVVTIESQSQSPV